MANVIMPKMGDAMEAGTLVAWKVKDGETVKSGDIIAEIETDKSNVEIEAEDAGVFRSAVAEGTSVPVGDIIATIGGGEPTTKRSQTEPKVETSTWKPNRAPATPPAPVASAAGPEAERVKASPLARRIARERGLDIAEVVGTGPNGRILESDVLTFKIPDAPTSKPAQAPAQAAGAEGVEPTSIRQVIARRMVESKTTIPHFYITVEVDVEELSALREKLNNYDPTLPKISFNDMIVKAAGKVLEKVPEVNSVYRDGKVYRASGQHVGIAVALEDGLIVPVIRDAGAINLREIARRGRDLIARARERKLQPDEYSGGTFTVSNLGSYGVDNFIAIIDPSQGAILAVGAIAKRAVVLDDGSIGARRRMNVTFSGDHRLIDGACGARFMQELKRLVQNPVSLME